MITVGTILRGQVPHWGMLSITWVRILGEDAAHVRIRITPQGATIATQVWVHRSELELAIRGGMLEPTASAVTCESCGGQMQKREARVHRQTLPAWACRECDEVQLL